MSGLAGKTMFMSGGSRGIGLAIAKRVAADGANVALISKTAEPNAKLPGTIYTAAKEIEEAGGNALPIVGDIRFDDQVEAAVAKTVEAFGGIDICLNNASAINLSGTEQLPMKSYDLMQDINARGTYLVSRTCVPYLKQAENPHILSLSPPLNLSPHWFANNLAYTMAKYGMSMCTLGISAEFVGSGIAVDSLWPRTAIATAAVQNLLGGDNAMRRTRKPEIMADAAYEIFTRPSRETTGNFYIDDEVLAQAGVTDLSAYAFVQNADLIPDFFLDG